jgi:hypothetical protein
MRSSSACPEPASQAHPCPSACRSSPTPGAPSRRPELSSSCRLPLSDVPARYVRIAPFRCEHASTICQINRCHASRQWQHVQSECRWMGFRFVGRLFTRQHDWRQFCFRFSAIPKLGAPAEQSTRGKSGRATAETLFPGYSHSSTMASFSSLVKLRRWVRPSRAESAAVASVKSRSTTDSLAALLALVLICRRGARMKLRSPINFDLANVDQISPAAQAGPRGLVAAA